MPKEKSKYGQYFTRPEIADFMVRLITKPKSAAILEPCCGKGVFLQTLSQHGYANVTAYEIDDRLSREYDNVRYRSFVSSPLGEKFDVAIGNPPYIRWKNLEPELKQELEGCQLWRRHFNSLCDYLFLFILKAIEQLNEGGELIYICSEYWLNSTNAKTLREYMCNHGYFTEIFHFKEAPLFDQVTASVLVFRYVKSSGVKARKLPAINFHLYTGKTTPKLQELLSRQCFKNWTIPQFEPGKRWLLTNAETQSRLESFEHWCSAPDELFDGKIVRLGDYCDIGNGMVSGLDRAFKLDDCSELTPKENACTITVLKAKDLDQFAYNSTSKYMFMLNSGKRYGEEEFRVEFPNFYRKLYPYIHDLQQRYCYNREIPYWEFVFPRNRKLFERKMEKIFVPCKERISNKSHFRFCLAPANAYPLQDVTCIAKKDSCRESLEYILAYLNSDIVFKWLCINGIVKGEIVEFSEAPIASIPYRKIDWKSQTETTLHDAIAATVRHYLVKRDHDGRNEINRLMGELEKHGH